MNGYDIIVCSCAEGPYLGARKAGTVCTCERCGFITEDQLNHIVDLTIDIATIQAVEDVRDIFCGEDTLEWARKAQGSMLSLPHVIETLDSVIEEVLEDAREAGRFDTLQDAIEHQGD